MGQKPEASPAKSAASGAKSSRWRPILLLAVLLSLLAAVQLLGLADRLADLQQWLQALGPWGPLAFLLVYIAAVVAAVPGSLLTIAIGALFGSVPGVILVSIGATVGASLAFLIARYFARDAVVDWFSHSRRFQQLESLTARHGALMVAFTRLVPLFPFNILNYAFGLTNIPFWTYVFWSWLGMLPEIILFVVGADAVAQTMGHKGVPWVLVGVFVAVLALVILLARNLRRRLKL